ncbi:MAG: sigma-70 family RNA polymerase sigma factor [Bryobacteraceae bacterium]
MTTSVRAASTQSTLTTAQQQLVTDHMSLVPGIARQLVKRFSLPHWIDIEEMESCGYVGLCKAALNFDPNRSNFGTYAHLLVRGAIIDDYHRSIRAPMFHDVLATGCKASSEIQVTIYYL